MIRIVVIEDEPLARQHLVDLLGELPGVEVVADAENGRLGLAAIAEHGACPIHRLTFAPLKNETPEFL